MSGDVIRKPEQIKNKKSGTELREPHGWRAPAGALPGKWSHIRDGKVVSTFPGIALERFIVWWNR
jgi:hypothetical protein